jgi:hypothetical protein
MVFYALDIYLGRLPGNAHRKEKIDQQPMPLLAMNRQRPAFGSQPDRLMRLQADEAVALQTAKSPNGCYMGNPQTLGNLAGAGLALFLDKIRDQLRIVFCRFAGMMVTRRTKRFSRRTARLL